jgi:hypothetical protein
MNILAPFLDIRCIVFGTEIKKTHVERKLHKVLA